MNFDKLFEVYARDLAKGVKAKGPGDQFEMHEELSSGNVTEEPTSSKMQLTPIHNHHPMVASEQVGLNLQHVVRGYL